MVSVGAVLVNATFPPPVLVALNPPTVLALVSVVPPTERVVSVPVVPKVPVPEIVPDDVALILPEGLLTAALTARLLPAPLLLSVTAPPALRLAFTASAF